MTNKKKATTIIALECVLKEDLSEIENITITPIGHKIKWISVKEGMPDNTDEVLVFERWCEVPFIGWYDKIRKLWCLNYDFLDIVGNAYGEDNITQKEVTHWMPLPEPPEGE